ncbi:hypothetical protein ND486_25635 [Pseudonocardia sp. DR1-2]|uniref:hypothetical protein n=1 Tax=Pseudonocardia sp. DR1-2 TaxID=2951168 RepID=UPI002043A8C2|nr:hypothetical protein [Pseudonocardia sp. DR1-2]MCM3849582.1 hypothetical protein [Pseudonocardia sp. DR1-2]
MARRDSVVITLASICEGFADHVLALLIARAGRNHGTFERLLIKHVGDDFYSSWDSRLKWLSHGFDLLNPGSRVVQDLRVMVELRNAIVHGDGSLSSFQTRQLAKQLTLERQLYERLEVTIEARAYYLSGRTVAQAKGISVSFVEELDKALTKKLKE